MNVLTRLWQFIVWLLLLTPLRCIVSGSANESNIPFEPVGGAGDGDDDSDIDSDNDERIFSSTELYCSCESKNGDANGNPVDESCGCSQSIRNRNSSPLSSSSPTSPTPGSSSNSSTSPSTVKLQMNDGTTKQLLRQNTESYNLLPARSNSYELLAVAPEDAKNYFEDGDRKNYVNSNGDTPSTRFDVGFADTIGKRSSMEDTHLIRGSFCDNPDNDLFLLFDGHNGRTAAEYARNNIPDTLEQLLTEGIEVLSSTAAAAATPADNDSSVAHKLKKAFVTTHRAIIKKDVGGGTTAAAVLFLGDAGYVAHTGDSMVAVHTPGTGLRVLTRPHRPTDPREAEMVRQRGGFILRFSSREVRVNGILAVTRALGDRELGTSITAEPDVSAIPFDWSDPPTIIIACDGLWDYMSEESVGEIMKRYSDDPRVCAEELRNAAYQVGGSTDNISVMIIKAKKRPN